MKRTMKVIPIALILVLLIAAATLLAVLPVSDGVALADGAYEQVAEFKVTSADSPAADTLGAKFSYYGSHVGSTQSNVYNDSMGCWTRLFTLGADGDLDIQYQNEYHNKYDIRKGEIYLQTDNASVSFRLGYDQVGSVQACNGKATLSFSRDANGVKDALFIIHNNANTTVNVYIGWIKLYEKAPASTVTLNQNGGNGGTSSVSATNGSAMPAATMPTKTGYDFQGYFDTSAATGGTKYYNANGTSAKNWDKTADTTLWARWSAKTCTVTFDKQNGENGDNSVTATYDAAMPAATMPTREGYTFLGYFDATTNGVKYYNADGTSAKAWDKVTNTTLYAMWKIEPSTVVGLINAIPNPVVYTQACKDAIDAARAGYDDLSTDDERNQVTNYATLTSAETTYNAMQADKEALDAYKIIRKGDADGMAEGGDSAACVTLIANAKTVIDDVVYDYTKSLDENKAVVDAIISVLAAALDLQRDKDAFDAYKALQKNAADDLAEVGDSAACGDLIAAAKDDIDALVYDEDKTLDENKAIVDAIISALTDALTAQRNDEEAAAHVDDLIDAIPDPVVYPDSKAAIDAARAGYDALTPAQKALVEDLEDLTDAETAYKDLEDNAKADQVDALIDAIVTPIAYPGSGASISAARAAYDALTSTQKGLVDDYNDLTAAEAAYRDLENAAKVAEVQALIDAIGTVEYTTSTKEKIEAARLAYNALSEEQKVMVNNQKVAILVQDETDYQGLADAAKANEVKVLINDIGTVKYPDSKEKIESARTGYDGLTETQKGLVDNYSVLTEAETAYAELEAKANDGLSGGAIAGIVVGSVVGFWLILLVVLFLLKKKRDDEIKQKKESVEE